MFDLSLNQATIKTVGAHQFYLFPKPPTTPTSAIALPRMPIPIFSRVTRERVPMAARSCFPARCIPRRTP